VSPASLVEEADVLVQDVGDGELVAGRIPWERQRHSGKRVYEDSFELYYIRNCRYRLTLEQCYSLFERDYRYGSRGRDRFRRRRVLRGQRVFGRYDDDLWRRSKDADDLWRLRDRRRIKVLSPNRRLKNQRDSLKKQIKLRNRQLNRRDQRIDELKDRLEDITERDRNRERRRARRRRNRDDD
ncbi:MAG: hypothetical protein AAF329_28720, partial [Cyanobacteria bacterium P01_A01_bin.17]